MKDAGVVSRVLQDGALNGEGAENVADLADGLHSEIQKKEKRESCSIIDVNDKKVT